MTDAHEFSQLGGHDDDAFSLFDQPPEQAVDFKFRADVNAARRLVENENIRVLLTAI